MRGGFVSGDKSKIQDDHRINAIREKLLQHGISVISINYPFENSKRLDGILDSASQIVQYLKYNSTEFNIDKQRMGMFGESAGWGISLYVGLSDDNAIPNSSDPIKRESTRINAIGHIYSQASYDVEQLPIMLGTELPSDNIDFFLSLYDIVYLVDLNKIEMVELRSKVNFYELMDSNDPPLFLQNYQSMETDNLLHHPRHAIFLNEQCKARELDCTLNTLETPKNERVDMAEFFIRQFQK